MYFSLANQHQGNLWEMGGNSENKGFHPCSSIPVHCYAQVTQQALREQGCFDVHLTYKGQICFVIFKINTWNYYFTKGNMD